MSAEPASETHLRLTPAGQAVLALALPVAILPADTAWIVQVLCLVAFLFLLQWLVGRANLARLAFDPPQPASAFAWESFPLSLGLHHAGGGLSARDVLCSHGSAGRDRLRSFAYFATLAPGADEALRTPYRLPRRGHHRSYACTLSSSFPFGLLERRRSWDLPADLLAYPRMGELRGADEVLELRTRRRGAEALQGRGQEEFHALRLWREGMSQRLVHWKASARLQKLVLREMRGEEHHAVHLVLVRHVLDPAGRLQRPGRVSGGFERAVSLTATLAELALRRDIRLRVSFLGDRLHERTLRRGRSGLFTLLADLARVEPLPVEADAAAALARLPAARGERRVVIYAGGESLATASLPWGAGRAAPHAVVLDLDAPEVLRRFRPLRRTMPPVRLPAVDPEERAA